MNYQKGSATVEATLIIGVLVIFAMGIPMLGSMVDLKQKTIEASRYVAWEKTVHTNDNSVVAQIDTRFFMNESAPIRTIAPGKEYLGQNKLWGALRTDTQVAHPKNLQLFQRARITADVENIRTHIGEGVSEWGSGYPNNNKDTAESDNQPGNSTPRPDGGVVFSSIGKAVSEIGSFISKDGWGKNEPFSNGLMRSEIEVKVENNKIMNIAGKNCSQGGAGCFQESTAILVDGWSAADPTVVRSRVHGFVPSARLERVGDFISKVSLVPMMADLENLKDSFGCVKLGVRPAKKMRALPIYEEVLGDNC